MKSRSYPLGNSPPHPAPDTPGNLSRSVSRIRFNPRTKAPLADTERRSGRITPPCRRSRHAAGPRPLERSRTLLLPRVVGLRRAVRLVTAGGTKDLPIRDLPRRADCGSPGAGRGPESPRITWCGAGSGRFTPGRHRGRPRSAPCARTRLPEPGQGRGNPGQGRGGAPQHTEGTLRPLRAESPADPARTRGGRTACTPVGTPLPRVRASRRHRRGAARRLRSECRSVGVSECRGGGTPWGGQARHPSRPGRHPHHEGQPPYRADTPATPRGRQPGDPDGPATSARRAAAPLTAQHRLAGGATRADPARCSHGSTAPSAPLTPPGSPAPHGKPAQPDPAPLM